MKSIILGVIIFGLIIGVIYYIQSDYFENNEVVENNTEDMKNKVEDEDSEDISNTMPALGEDNIDEMIVTRAYAREEVSFHNNKDDCWLVLHGKVYDVTAFIPTHPGGPAILQGCGKDATELFETRPMGSGTPHSEGARNFLEQYHIGEFLQ